MAFFNKLNEIQKSKKTCLSVGLDPNLEKLPQGLAKDAEGIYEFCWQIIQATAPLACAFKPQIAYFAAYGAEDVLQQLIKDSQAKYPDVLIVLDAKRGDIGTTAEMYAREAFERYGADAVTVNPYMGEDAVAPFTSYGDKGVFLLCRTSNPAAHVTQNVPLANGSTYYHYLADTALTHWNDKHNIGLVVGATSPAELADLRLSFPKTWFLVPGVGAQGGSLAEVMTKGKMVDSSGVLVNSARGIIYASSGADYAEAAHKKSAELQAEMATYIN